MWSKLKFRMFPWQQPMVLVYVMLVLGSDLLVPVVTLQQSWHSNDVISKDEISHEAIVFPGEKDKLDYFKILRQEGDFMLVGARNKVRNISLETLQEDLDRQLVWTPNNFMVNKCKNQLEKKYHSKCDNFIQVLGKNGNQYNVCGTNAFNPTCRLYEYSEGNPPSQAQGYTSNHEEPGRGKCAYDPEHNSTAIFVGSHLYSATVTDSMARDPLIIAFYDGQNKTRTEQYNSNMLNNPHFVSSFDVSDTIFFFFRENAIENINCGKAIFSRVARVCKQDRGGRYENVWTSFSKARLNCSIPGDIPFAFDEIQSTSMYGNGNYLPTSDPSNRTGMFYGVFNTPENSIHGSAICVFSYSDIMNTFHGRFKKQDSLEHNWLPVPREKEPNPHPLLSCNNDSKNISQRTKTREFLREHPLMDKAVNTMGGAPVLIYTNAKGRFTAIAIDWQVLAVDRHYYDVMFIGTTDGRVLKAINAGRDGEVKSVVIEDIQVLGQNEAVQDLKIYRKGTVEKLIIVSRERIVSIPLHRCHRHKFCGDCVAAQDPYCAWQDGCNSHTSRGVQNILTGDASQCPDGGVNREAGKVAMSSTTSTATPAEVPTACPTCKCDCNKTQSVELDTNKNNRSGDIPINPDPAEAEEAIGAPSTGNDEPCEPRYIPVRTGTQTHTTSIIIACVVCIVVSVVGFVIGYRVSLCRNNTRNTEQMINYEQHFGSLRKNPNRQSIEATNFYSEPGVQKPYKIQNYLVSNNIPHKSANAPNGSIESKTVSAKQASKTYL